MSTNSAIRERFLGRLNGQARIQYEHKGPFTICLFEVFGNKAIGVAKRNFQADKDDPGFGEGIALMRAARDFIVTYPKDPLVEELLDYKTLYRLGIE